MFDYKPEIYINIINNNHYHSIKLSYLTMLLYSYRCLSLKAIRDHESILRKSTPRPI